MDSKKEIIYFDSLTERLGKLLFHEVENGIAIIRSNTGDIYRLPVCRLIEINFIDDEFFILPCHYVDINNFLSINYQLMKFLHIDEIKSSNILGIFKKNRIKISFLANSFAVASCEYDKGGTWSVYNDFDLQTISTFDSTHLDASLSKLWSLRKSFLNERS